MPLRSVSGESRPMRLSGMPCHSCTMSASDTAKRFTSPNPCVTTMIPARAVSQNPRGERFRADGMPRAAASRSSRA